MIKAIYCPFVTELEKVINLVGWDSVKQILHSSTPSGPEFVVIYEEDEG